MRSEIVREASCLRADWFKDIKVAVSALSTFTGILVVNEGPEFFPHTYSNHERVDPLNNRFSIRKTTCRRDSKLFSECTYKLPLNTLVIAFVYWLTRIKKTIWNIEVTYNLLLKLTEHESRFKRTK